MLYIYKHVGIGNKKQSGLMFSFLNVSGQLKSRKHLDKIQERI